jgi:hypothetical protein
VREGILKIKKIPLIFQSGLEGNLKAIFEK